MKFRAVRRINLANLDEKLFGYEHEEFEVSEASSMEEATTILDQWVNQRISFYRGLMAAKGSNPSQPTLPSTPPPARMPSQPPEASFNLPPGVSKNPPKGLE